MFQSFTGFVVRLTLIVAFAASYACCLKCHYSESLYDSDSGFVTLIEDQYVTCYKFSRFCFNVVGDGTSDAGDYAKVFFKGCNADWEHGVPVGSSESYDVCTANGDFPAGDGTVTGVICCCDTDGCNAESSGCNIGDSSGSSGSSGTSVGPKSAIIFGSAAATTLALMLRIVVR